MNTLKRARLLTLLALYAPLTDARAQAIRIADNPPQLLLFMLAIPLLLTIIAGVGVHRRQTGGPPYVRTVLIYWFVMIVICAGIAVGSRGLGLFAPIVLLFSPWLLAVAMFFGFFVVKKTNIESNSHQEASKKIGL